jgi:hypothetical protein
MRSRCLIGELLEVKRVRDYQMRCVKNCSYWTFVYYSTYLCQAAGRCYYVLAPNSTNPVRTSRVPVCTIEAWHRFHHILSALHLSQPGNTPKWPELQRPCRADISRPIPSFVFTSPNSFASACFPGKCATGLSPSSCFSKEI